MKSALPEQACLRRLGRARRAALSPQERREKGAAIAARVLALPVYVRADTILAYLSLEEEVPTAALIEQARRQGKRVALPLCAEGVLSAAVPRENDALRVGAFGILEPLRERCEILAPTEIDLILAPLTAFDERCGRIGMGGGYYDRFLPQTDCAAVGLAFACQQVADVGAKPTDIALTAVATENALHTQTKNRFGL